MTTLLIRAKSSHDLTWVLCALLAWPANLPGITREVVRLELATRSFLASPVGPCLDGSERKPHHCSVDWSIDADNAESSDGRDDLRYAPLAMPHCRLDLPSLVPSSIESPLFGPVCPVTSFQHSTPLRC